MKERKHMKGNVPASTYNPPVPQPKNDGSYKAKTVIRAVGMQEVVVIWISAGSGTETDPHIIKREYWTTDGHFIGVIPADDER